MSGQVDPKPFLPFLCLWKIYYCVQYNPRNLSDIDYFIYGDGDIERLDSNEELILAFSDYYYK